MNISGSGCITAGEYNEKISISGSGRMEGNIRCIALSCSGSVKGSGSVSCSEEIRISGSCQLDGGISAHHITASGSARIGQDIKAETTVKASGAISCGGSIQCASLIGSGAVIIGKEAEAEEISISGKIKCTGLMNAEKIDISLVASGNDNRIGSIGGSEIRIHNDWCKNKVSRSVARLPLLSKLVGSAGLVVDELVEGDVVALEWVKCPKVTGRVVAIGEGCDIELVQYSEEIEIHPDAKVGKCEKI